MLAICLQRFAGEKTERATQRRRQDVRREGNIPKSAELTSAFGFVAAVVALRVFGSGIWNGWEAGVVNGFAAITTKPLTQATVAVLCLQLTWAVVRLVLPVVAAAALASIGVAYMQVGSLFVPNMLLPQFSRINPLAGFRRLFSIRSSIEALKSALKLAIVGSVTYLSIGGLAAQIVNLSDTGINQLPGLVGNIVFRLALEIGSMMLALAVGDALWQRLEFERSIRMSKEEIREERKQQEGDPKIKSNIRRRGYALAYRRMMQAVPQADVVVTNPTHFAVALSYVAGRMSAPVVVAKGQDEIAQRIRRTAEQAQVPLVENKPLAQALFKSVEIGQQVPEELYAAVAEVLAYVYRLKQAGVRG